MGENPMLENSTILEGMLEEESLKPDTGFRPDIGFNVVVALLTLFAGPYRAIAFRHRAFEGVGLGIVAWLGIVAGYPAFVVWLSPYDLDTATWLFWTWLMLIVWGWFQMFVTWCSRRAYDAG